MSSFYTRFVKKLISNQTAPANTNQSPEALIESEILKTLFMINDALTEGKIISCCLKNFKLAHLINASFQQTVKTKIAELTSRGSLFSNNATGETTYKLSMDQDMALKADLEALMP